MNQLERLVLFGLVAIISAQSGRSRRRRSVDWIRRRSRGSGASTARHFLSLKFELFCFPLALFRSFELLVLKFCQLISNGDKNKIRTYPRYDLLYPLFMAFHFEKRLDLAQRQVLPIAQSNKLIKGAEQLVGISKNLPLV